MKIMNRILILISLSLILACTKKNPQPEGRYLHLPLKDNVKTSDPTNAYDVISLEVVSQVYETPYQYNYYAEKMEPIPNLADGMPSISNGGKTYTLKIKKGVIFQNDPCFKEAAGKGRELKSHDFIYGWKRHANPATESQGFWIWDSKVVGINDFRKKFGKEKPAEEVMKESVEGFTALDDYTIQIKLLKPYPQLVHILTMVFTAPVPKEAIEFYGKDFVNHPVGTGPFKVHSWEPTSRMVLVKNENYRKEIFPDLSKHPKHAHLARFSGKQLPLVDGLEFTVVKEEQPRWLGFLSGKFDQIEIPKDNFKTAIESNKTEVTSDLKKKGIFVSIESAFSYWWVSMNMKDKVLGTNKYLRQAIVSAVDRKGWLELFKNGRGSIQTEINPPSISDRCGKTNPWTFDLDKAKKLMAKAGHPDGKGLAPLKWDTRGTTQSERQIAEFVAKNLNAIGIKIEVLVNTFPAYLDKQNKGNLQISKGGWVMDYPDAENSMQLLYGPNKAPGPNEANFDHPEYNKLYDQMAVLAPSSTRQGIICKMEKIIQEEVPWAYVMYETEYRLVQPWLNSYHAAELVLNKYKYIDLDEEKRTLFANK